MKKYFVTNYNTLAALLSSFNAIIKHLLKDISPHEYARIRIIPDFVLPIYLQNTLTYCNILNKTGLSLFYRNGFFILYYGPEYPDLTPVMIPAVFRADNATATFRHYF